MSDVTRILSQIESGDPTAAEQLLPLVYEELRRLVAARLAQEKPGQTLQAIALVHEAYVRLVGGGLAPRVGPPRILPATCCYVADAGAGRARSRHPARAAHRSRLDQAHPCRQSAALRRRLRGEGAGR